MYETSAGSCSTKRGSFFQASTGPLCWLPLPSRAKQGGDVHGSLRRTINYEAVLFFFFLKRGLGGRGRACKTFAMLRKESLPPSHYSMMEWANDNSRKVLGFFFIIIIFLYPFSKLSSSWNIQPNPIQFQFELFPCLITYAEGSASGRFKRRKKAYLTEDAQGTTGYLIPSRIQHSLTWTGG